jgi:hypothetical protein
MSSVFDSSPDYCCKHLFSLMKNVKSRNTKRLTKEHLEDACESQQQKLNLILKYEAVLKQEKYQVSSD